MSAGSRTTRYRGTRSETGRVLENETSLRWSGGAKTTGAWSGVTAKTALLGRREKDSVSERYRDSTRDCDQRIATKV